MGERSRRAVSRSGYWHWWTSSVFRVPKKLSIGALSQRFALRLIDWVMTAACRMSRYWLAAYWLIVATQCWHIGRHRRPTPRCLTVTQEEFNFDRRYHRKHVIWHRCFRRCWWPNLDKHSAVLGLVQDEPALRAGAASGILDKTCARRSAGGRSAPRNGPFSLTKECNLDLGSGEVASEAMVTSQHGQFRTSLDMADISNWSSASAGVCQASVFRGLVLRAAATAAMSSALCMLRSVPF